MENVGNKNLPEQVVAILRFTKNSFLVFLEVSLQRAIRSYKEPMPLLLELEHRLMDLGEL
ncbi:MAG: hypothetical protein ABS69_10375 [Nitrosomonadales bacterium SCN 54-20]|nr:MAG: hypothetical protein ABS69_10375 [Nitrosomonadales bacterium SCN 54-20]